jgi:predicted phosphodiesterase
MTDKTLVVGDVHVSPGQSLRRAVWLGQHIRATKPNRVVFIGDFLSFDSLSAWDRDKRKAMEGRRYAKDVAAGREFLGTMHDQVPDAYCSVEWVYVEGNHENRLHRYMDHDPTFDGAFNYLEDMEFRWDRVIPYKESYVHRGVHFTHVPIMENGNPVTGKYVTNRALEVYGAPVVFGHTHKFNVSAVHRKGMAHLHMAVNVGCYFEHIDEYAKGSQTSYWRGLVELDHYKQCGFDINAIRIGHLKRMYK